MIIVIRNNDKTPNYHTAGVLYTQFTSLYKCYVTGWWWQCDTVTDVKDVYHQYLPWNPDSESITIITASSAGSHEYVGVKFYDEDDYIGAVWIRFSKRIQYYIGWCGGGFTNFPGTLPTATQRTWTITYNYTDKRVVYYCNGVQVLNVVVSDKLCPGSNWRENWKRKLTQIKLQSYKTSSDKYCISSKPGT